MNFILQKVQRDANKGQWWSLYIYIYKTPETVTDELEGAIRAWLSIGIYSKGVYIILCLLACARQLYACVVLVVYDSNMWGDTYMYTMHIIAAYVIFISNSKYFCKVDNIGNLFIWTTGTLISPLSGNMHINELYDSIMEDLGDKALLDGNNEAVHHFLHKTTAEVPSCNIIANI